MPTVRSSDIEYEIEEGKSPELHKQDLPDSEFEGEKYSGLMKAFPICSTHSRTSWKEHNFYVDNHDGTISCEFCPWGAKLGGNLRVHEGKIVDLAG